MVDPNDKLNQLQARLDNLAKYEAAFKREIADIRNEIWQLKLGTASEKGQRKPSVEPPADSGSGSVTQKPVIEPPKSNVSSEPTKPAAPRSEFEPGLGQQQAATLSESNVEKFVGTYLISIVGILVLVIGVGIGAKFAIDNNLISPLMRIIFGYTAGLLLTGVAVRLKARYETFSAIVLSGGMAILYFITYFAFGYYYLISQTTAFGLMVIFTVFTVLAAIIYNRQIIAHLGLVGAYAVPFLLSDGSGRILVLFSYVVIINTGILAVSVYKYWRTLFFSSFFITWLIFSAFYVERYTFESHFVISLSFVFTSFAIFYATFLAYCLVHEQDFETENIALVILNAFVFFCFGYSILSDSDYSVFLGAFALFNAFLHFGVAVFIRFLKPFGRVAFYSVVTLALTSLTLVVPIEADGNLVTGLWFAESLFLFGIGRTRKIPVFEYFSFPLLGAATLGILAIWVLNPPGARGIAANTQTPLLHSDFTAALFAAFVFGAMACIDRLKKHKSPFHESLSVFIRFLLPAAFLVVLYNTFRLEIDLYFQSRKYLTAFDTGEHFIEPKYNPALRWFNGLWQLNYSFLFVSLFTLVNIRKFKLVVNGAVGIILIAGLIFIFSTLGLLGLGELRELYLGQNDGSLFLHGTVNIWIRYVCALFALASIFVLYKQLRENYIAGLFPDGLVAALFDLGFCTTLFLYFSSELFNWTDLLHISEPAKLWLSLLWGLYAITLIVIGISARKKHLRVFAILLFGLTIAKLFVYDVENLNTISKTALFVSVGLMLLVASFLYNKYTKRIFGEGI